LVRLDAEDCYLVNINSGKEKKLFSATDLKKIKGTGSVPSLLDATFPEEDKTIVKNRRPAHQLEKENLHAGSCPTGLYT
jgi:hypothetical protein